MNIILDTIIIGFKKECKNYLSFGSKISVGKYLEF